MIAFLLTLLICSPALLMFLLLGLAFRRIMRNVLLKDKQ